MPWYVKFDDIDGSSTFKNHIHWMNVARVDFGKPKIHGGGSGVGKAGGGVQFDEITMDIRNDLGAPKLMEAVLRGTVFKKVELHATAMFGDDGEQVYLAFELENVMISSFQVSKSAPNDVSVTINFSKYKSKLTEYGADGKRGGTAEYSWKNEDGGS